MSKTKLILIIWMIIACLATVRVCYGEPVGDSAMSGDCLEVVTEIIDKCELYTEAIINAKEQCRADYRDLAKQCKESTGASVDSPGWLLTIGIAILAGLIGGLM